MPDLLKRTLCLALLLIMIFPAYAEETPPTVPYPPLDEEGYLLDDAAGAEFVHKDYKAGFWCYISKDLRIDIHRFKDKLGRRQAVWFVSEIHARNGMLFRSFSESPDNPGKRRSRPEYIAQRHRVVYAQNGDLWTWRVGQKRAPGIIIREGQLIKDKTYKKAVNAVPALDELSLYADGRFEVRNPSEITSGDYLERGAYDVFSFGPILIRDGVMDPRLTEYFRDSQPRSAIGMVSPGHYVGVMVEGRTDRSHGSNLEFVAQQLLDRGCQVGFNLDGGQTSAMVFMGELVMREPTYNGFTNTRNQPDIIGIGISEAVKKRKQK